MPETLSRLKPDPVPAIRPVPEHAAGGRLAEVYARTKAGLNVPWMGVVAMAFAHYPRFYDCLWSAFEPVAGSAGFAASCRALREAAEREAGALGPAPLLPLLAETRYDAREIDGIRACNEVFSAGNMPYILMATLARLLLEGRDWPAGGEPGPPAARDPAPARPVLIEPHHADPTVAALYADIRGTLGLPFVNTDYRAFARWPSYFLAAWDGLKRAIGGPGYEAAVTRVHDAAVDLALALPNPGGLTPGALREAARADAPEGEVREVVRLFQWLLPGLAVNVAFLRAQLLEPGDG